MACSGNGQCTAPRQEEGVPAGNSGLRQSTLGRHPQRQHLQDQSHTCGSNRQESAGGGAQGGAGRWEGTHASPGRTGATRRWPSMPQEWPAAASPFPPNQGGRGGFREAEGGLGRGPRSPCQPPATQPPLPWCPGGAGGGAAVLSMRLSPPAAG